MFYIKWYKILNERNYIMNILADPKEFCNISRPPFNCENIPQEMKSYPQWCWAKITENKIPRIIGTDTNAKANGTNCENTWSKFEVYENIVKNDPSKAESYFAGFVLSNKDPYVIIDLDDKDTTTDAERATFRDIISEFCSYTEISSGGRGYHIILKCYDLPEKFAHNRKGHYEVYKDGRFMILTGNIYNNFKNIAVVKYEQICEFISKYCVNNEKQSIFTQKSIAENKTKPKNISDNPKPKNTPQNTKNNISLTDKQILDIAIKKTLNTANACLFGNSPYSNITDQSSADFALFCVLIEAGANSQEQVANIYHSLPIGSRDKAYRADYIERTYKNALEEVKNKPNNYANYQKTSCEKTNNNDYKNKPQIELPDLEVFDFVNENCNFTEPFPIEVLPQEVQKYINSLAGDTPPEIIALTALPAFATTYQGLYNLKSYKDKKFAILPTNLSSFILAPSSAGKSTTIKIFSDTLCELSKSYEYERQKIFKQIRALNLRLEKCLDAKEIENLKCEIDELENSLPVQNILAIDGTSTIEAMRLLVDTNKNLFIYNPEAGNLLAFGGKKDAIKYLTEYTNRHDGLAPEHRTKTQGVNKKTNLRASQVYMLQPTTFNDLGNDFLKLIIAQGTLSRTLFTCVYNYSKKPLDPTDLPTETTEEDPCLQRFNSVIENLFEMNHIWVCSVTHDLKINNFVMFEDACYAFYVEKYNEINSNLEDKNAQESSIYGKLLENAQRLAVCFHFMDLIFTDINPKTLTPNLPLSDYAKQPISLGCFKRAYKLAEYCAKSQIHYANIGKSYEQDNENILLTKRCIQTLFRAKFKNEMQITPALLANLTKTRTFKCKKADVDNIIPLLQKLGILLVNDDTSVNSRGYMFSINPRLFRDFNTFEEYEKKMIKYK